MLDARLKTLLCKKKLFLRNPKKWKPEGLIHDTHFGKHKPDRNFSGRL
jgi:hypothetical protein